MFKLTMDREMQDLYTIFIKINCFIRYNFVLWRLIFPHFNLPIFIQSMQIIRLLI